MKCPLDFSVTFDATGPSISQVGQEIPEISAAWAEVKKVTALKRDLLTFDLICIRVDFAGDRQLEISEDTPDWAELIEALPKHLQRCLLPNVWRERVTLPPFAACETTLYESDTVAPTKGDPA